MPPKKHNPATKPASWTQKPIAVKPGDERNADGTDPATSARPASGPTRQRQGAGCSPPHDPPADQPTTRTKEIKPQQQQQQQDKANEEPPRIENSPGPNVGVVLSAEAEAVPGISLPPASPHDATPPLYEVKALTPQLSTNWAFICRVLWRGKVRQYSNIRGAGRLSEIYVADAVGDIFRATLFNEAISKYHEVVEPGATCYFAVGRVKLAEYAPPGMTYEATFGADADIHVVCKEKEVLGDPALRFTPLSRLTELPSRTSVTIAGVIHAVGNIKRVTSAKGNRVEKREFALVDTTNTKVFCTSWGQFARDCDSDYQGRVLVIIGAQVSDYNGSRSINVGFGAAVLSDPAISISAQLRTWYTALPQDFNFEVLGV